MIDPPSPEQLYGKLSTSSRLGELSLRVLDHISAMVAYWDADQVCLFANQAYLQWFGKSREQLLGTSMRNLLGPLYQQNLPYILGVLSGEAQVFERALPTPSGVLRHSIATYTPDIVDGTVRGFFVHVSDVSPLKAAQQEMERAQKAAEDASRAKSEFLATMSHEIRTPLNAILGLTELLVHTPLDPQQSDYLNKIDVAGRSLLGIINEILDFSKLEAGKMAMVLSEFSLDDVLEELADIVGATSEGKELEVVFLSAPDVPRRLLGDPGRLKQVLINLTRNAVKFTERGEIVLEIAREAESSDGTVKLRFSVRDTGIGIPVDQLERIFEPFTQSDSSTTRSYGGTGLGLTISRRLVRMMDGELSVESTPGRGSTFHFSIPLGVGTASLPSAVAAAPVPESLRMLAVCQSPLVSRFLAEACGSLGWQHVAVDDASAVASLLSRSSATSLPREVVFVNWPLSGDLGLALAGQLGNTPDANRPVLIFLVQSYASSSLSDALQVGQGLVFDEFIRKPTSASVIHRTVMRALRRRDAAAGTSHNPQPKLGQNPVPRLKGLRLLLIDDNPINLEVANSLLIREGAAVSSVASGRAALAALCAAPGSFDAVLTDIQMPKLDGYQTAREIRRNPALATLPVIAISAGVLWQERDKCREAGMNGFIAKPLVLEEVVLLIDSLTARSSRRLDNAGLAAAPAGPDSEAPAPSVHFDIRRSLAPTLQDAAALTHLLKLFMEDNAAMGSTIRNALQRGDLRGAASALHRLRGTAEALGASRLAKATLALERCLFEGDLSKVHSEMREFEAALSEALQAARSFLRTRA